MTNKNKIISNLDRIVVVDADALPTGLTTLDGSQLSSITAANVIGDVAGANHANIADVANVAYSVDAANIVGSASEIANGSSNVNIPVADSSIELWVNGAWVGNIAPDESNVTSNFSAGGTITGGNLTTSGGISGFDINVTDLYVNGGYANLGDVTAVHIIGGSSGQYLQTDGSGILSWADIDFANATVANANYSTYAGTVTGSSQSNITSVGTLTGLTVNGVSNLGAVGNITITGGGNTQVLSTDGTGNLSWAAPGLNYKYTKEWHVDPVNGNDTTGDGSYNKPYLTVAKALTSTGPAYAAAVYLHAGAYSENVTIVSPVENVEIIGVNDTGTTQFTGNWAFSHTGTSIRVRNVRFSGTVTQTTTGPVYFDDCTLSSFTKSGTAYTQFDMCDVTTANFTSNALTLFRGGSISSLTLNNATARVYVYNMTTVATTTVTAGIYFAFDSTLYSSSPTTNAITSSAGTTVGVYRSQITNSSGTSSRVSLAGNWTINDSTYDVTNSTLTGTNLGTISYFDSLNIRGISTLGAVGNVKISGGTNGQFLQTNGSGVLSFASAPAWVAAPATNTSTGVAGQAAYDSGGNLYICVAANTWSKITGTTSW